MSVADKEAIERLAETVRHGFRHRRMMDRAYARERLSEWAWRKAVGKEERADLRALCRGLRALMRRAT